LYEQQRERFRQNWGVNRLYADYAEMLFEEKPDIVSVTTKTATRHQIVLDVARSGARAIYAEKPLAMSLAEADEMIALCRDHGVLLAIGCDRNYDPHWQGVRHAIASGAIGDVLQITMNASCAISHNGSHALALMRYLVGDDAAWVFGEGDPDADITSNDDLPMNGYIAFRNGARGFIRSRTNGPVDWTIDIVGTAGTIRSINMGLEIELLVKTDSGVVSRQSMPRPKVLRSPTENLVHGIVDYLENGTPHLSTGEDGLAALETAIAFRQSHREGFRRIDLPLGDRSLCMNSRETLGAEADLPEALKRDLIASRSPQ
jgi:predicted dehydrogenase